MPPEDRMKQGADGRKEEGGGSPEGEAMEWCLGDFQGAVGIVGRGNLHLEGVEDKNPWVLWNYEFLLSETLSAQEGARCRSGSSRGHGALTRSGWVSPGVPESVPGLCSHGQEEQRRQDGLNFW